MLAVSKLRGQDVTRACHSASRRRYMVDETPD
jgi:hypothetical protein